ncbi:D-lactate dehydrogenase [Dyadobacter sp. BE34]|uniref:D-lactate dehydrogenase n=1 Tax=Dyadobacter fermentans TaxID=94254 RepID=A0ABU1QUT2_9BACT|nr:MULTISPECIES: 2-hydroxyacid dehydrogenase [Dyadobacter]MDR6804919.1 D-lactate dehydrogenase [Dyadobacter fermentans]MDR7043322.1 D-lactate dehydrogenase [Dyadobacter sp. BE242]MDR7197634.1 D-lactate dehydrogenase [Dyadobacter sp. BE34]MDR7214933.1 D-lactate dehydrogenase [Dyadobacter sp. BE31]MDR7262468.1 D-lactate dehydrogenase [Dyadobacter sp. BE32]
MKILFFSAKPYDKQFFDVYNRPHGFEIEYLETHLGPHIANAVDGQEAVCVFVNDKVNAEVIAILAEKGVKVIALRCAGFNNVDLEAARMHGIRVCRVPEYSPEAVAEHTVAMLLTLVRKTHKAYNRVREQNFSLNGLLGFNLHGKTIGVVGTGKIGGAFCRIMKGFGCKVLAYDLYPNHELQQAGIEYQPLEEVLRSADVISLHCPLNPATHYLINESTLTMMKPGVTLINTSRGGLINTAHAIEALKSKHLANLAIDVYEQEEKLFFKDLSESIIEDDTIQRLMSFPNVLVTAHQAFFTEEALTEIAKVTLQNIDRLLHGQEPEQAGAVLI